MAPQCVLQCAHIHPAHRQYTRPHVRRRAPPIKAQNTSPPPTNPSPIPRPPVGPPIMPQRPPTFGPPLTTPVRPLDVTVYFRCDWHQALLHGSIYGSEWEDHPMEQVTMGGVRWYKVSLQVPSVPPNGIAKGPMVEFVFTDGGDAWNKPADDGNYQADTKGIISVVDHTAQLVQGKPLMLVTDLDDTLIGDDEATLAFTKFWQSQACLVGSKLAYNTGRALDKFLHLLEEKHWCLGEPDCLISSVGTRIYYKQPDGRWVEDEDYLTFLDIDWDVQVMRDAAYKALVAVGDDVMHFRPPDEQNDHKITCGVMVGVLDQVEERLHKVMKDTGVKAQVITSGTGDWRFVDIISPQAGKLAALEYMRRHWGFELSNTVACGDSGNDIDMLGGRNLAIVVGNAQPDLVRWLDALAPNQLMTADGQARRLYRAKERRARGILEGLQALGFYKT